MPRRDIIAERHRSAFRRNGIEPSHSQWARVRYVEYSGGTCTLCGNTNLLHLYELRFDIPVTITHRNAETGEEVTLVEDHNTIVFNPVGSECIYNWVNYLRDMEADDESIQAWENGPVREVREIENNRALDRAKQRRYEKITEYFNEHIQAPIRDRFSETLRHHWANTLGDVSIDRLLELILETATYWREHARPNEETFGRVWARFNPTTMRDTQGRPSRLCRTCGEPIAMAATRISPRPGTNHGVGNRRINWQEPQIGTLRCALCGVERQGRGQLSGAHGLEYEVGGASTVVTDRDSFMNNPRSRTLPESLRNDIAAALGQDRSDIVRSIAAYALRNSRISGRQLQVIQDRGRPVAEQEEGAPNCPTHNVAMRRRSGQYNDYYSCPQYPACRITATLEGEIRGRPEDRRTRQTRPQPVRIPGEGLVSPPPAVRPPRRHVSSGRSRREARRANETTPTDSTIIDRIERALARTEQTELTHEPSSAANDGVSNTAERAAMIEQGRIFRRALEVTINSQTSSN